jgi:hypothetical protein
MYIYVKIPDEEITFREENSDIDEIKVLTSIFNSLKLNQSSQYHIYT